VGLLSPLNLLFGFSLAALIAIYLRAKSRPTIEVSSLMLFEEIPAPVAKSRMLRLDLLFWLEALALGALTFAVAGLYLRTNQAPGPGRRHALVFDLGAGMGAVNQGGGTRLDEARRIAGQIIGDAPASDQFTVLGYALEAETTHATGARPQLARDALATLKPVAVAARPAALRAALIRARSADQIDLFADRPPPASVIEDARLGGRINFHQVGAPAPNLAIVALDGGVPRATVGRCVVRNLSNRPQLCELVIEAGGREVFHSSLFAEPRAEIVVPFGPLQAGGLIHARIATPDALAADNQRWALAPSIAQAHALVLSPDAQVRDDLARIVLAINRNYLVTAADPNRADSFNRAQHFDLALIHDTSAAGVNATARLLIFPEPALDGSTRRQIVPVTSSVAIAEMQEREGAGILSAPVLLGPARVITPPPWMQPLARGVGVRERNSFPLAAIGYDGDQATGVLAFDVRDHLLLDPDRLDALILTVDLLQRLVAPRDLIIEPTGAFVAVTAGADARLIAPDGTARPLVADQWGRVRFRVLEAGRYLVTGNGPATAVYANYYDAGESDLSAPAGESLPSQREAVSAETSQPSVRPIVLPLVILALLALVGESVMLAQRAVRWRTTHV
jgi:Aerotolerance regulator N-terminal